MNSRHQKIIGMGLMMFGLGVILMLLSVPGTQAQGTAPATATPDTPPPANPKNGNNSRDDDHSPVVGAVIELRALIMPAEAWSVMQWQDANGDWQNVEGWQGTLENGVRQWWVHPKDFGTGPFRWAVFGSPGGALIAASEPFILPRFPNETARMEVKLR